MISVEQKIMASHVDHEVAMLAEVIRRAGDEDLADVLEALANRQERVPLVASIGRLQSRYLEQIREGRTDG